MKRIKTIKTMSCPWKARLKARLLTRLRPFSTFRSQSTPTSKGATRGAPCGSAPKIPVPGLYFPPSVPRDAHHQHMASQEDPHSLLNRDPPITVYHLRAVIRFNQSETREQETFPSKFWWEGAEGSRVSDHGFGSPRTIWVILIGFLIRLPKWALRIS